MALRCPPDPRPGCSVRQRLHPSPRPRSIDQSPRPRRRNARSTGVVREDSTEQDSRLTDDLGRCLCDRKVRPRGCPTRRRRPGGPSPRKLASIAPGCTISRIRESEPRSNTYVDSSVPCVNITAPPPGRSLGFRTGKSGSRAAPRAGLRSQAPDRMSHPPGLREDDVPVIAPVRAPPVVVNGRVATSCGAPPDRATRWISPPP